MSAMIHKGSAGKAALSADPPCQAKLFRSIFQQTMWQYFAYFARGDLLASYSLVEIV